MAYIYITLFLTLFLVVLFLYFQISKLKEVLVVKESITHELEQDIVVLKQELQEVRVGLMGLGKRIVKIQDMTTEVSEKQVEILDVDPDSKLYSRAVKMVELGADITEIMQECELPRAEAELLYSIHTKE